MINTSSIMLFLEIDHVAHRGCRVSSVLSDVDFDESISLNTLRRLV